MQTIYEAMKEAGVEVASHCSDLYVAANHTTTEILKRPEFEIHRKNSTSFLCQIEGTIHYDIPFAYDPYWDGLQGGDN